MNVVAVYTAVVVKTVSRVILIQDVFATVRALEGFAL